MTFGYRQRDPAKVVAQLWWALAVVAVVTVITLFHVSVSYYQISPGPTAPVNSLIRLPAAHRHRVDGNILLVTVYQAPAHASDLLLSWAHPNDQLVSSQELLGSTPASQLQAIEQGEMQASQQAAEVVALRRMGYPVVERGQGAEVGYVVKGKPAARVVKPGDTIVAINGTAVGSETAAAAILEKTAPGQTVALGVRAASGARRTVPVTLAARPGHPTQGFLGVGLFTKQTFSLPFPVSIDSQDIGGPSAGLAFTLGIIDELSGGRLTGGHLIAATGTMNLDGTVGDVGGVAQKTVSVSNSGATLFLVPTQEYTTARAHAGPHLKVVEVSDLSQALTAIARNGGDVAGLPPDPPGLH
jgi:PDZ domain-containing protein